MNGSVRLRAPIARFFSIRLLDANQDRLAEERGMCIMYTHTGKGFVSDGKLDPEFRRLMTRLSKMNGWFVAYVKHA